MGTNDELFLARPLSHRQLAVLDAVAATAYTLVVLAMALGRTVGDQGAAAIPAPVRLALVIGMGVPLAVRRHWPVPAFTTAFVTTTAAFALGVVHEGFVGAAFCLYTVALGEARPRRSLTLTAAAVGITGVALLVLAGSPPPVTADFGAIVVSAVVLAGAWTVGRAVRERRRYAKRAATELVAAAVAEERLRIARDLHDVVAHGLGLIVVKAGTANHVMDARPEEARDALRIIETTGRGAMVEMRHLLGVLRSEPTAVSGPTAVSVPDLTEPASELAPAPGIGQLRELADRVAAAGVPVELELDAPDGLPEGVSLAVYRIVQEALTNVARHAGPARCRVAVASSAEALEVEVVDDGRGASGQRREDGTGHGLIGMRERVRTLDGEFSAGPLPGRGFRVLARIPLGAPSAAPARSPR